MNTTPTEKTFSAFIPMVLIAVGMIILLSWNLYIVTGQNTSGVQISAQMNTQIEQARQTEQKLQQIMTDLVTLAKTDADADAIVKRYKIVYTSPAKAKTLSSLAP